MSTLDHITEAVEAYLDANEDAAEELVRHVRLVALRKDPADPLPWWSEVRGGADVADLRHVVGQSWTEEAVLAALGRVKDNPGRELVLSVHRSHPSAAKARLYRMTSPRWAWPDMTYKTRLLGHPGDDTRAAVVTVTYRPTTTTEETNP